MHAAFFSLQLASVFLDERNLFESKRLSPIQSCRAAYIELPG